MNKQLAILFFILFGAKDAFNQQTYHVEQLDSLQRVEARPVFYFFHTDWCTYCDRMQQKSLNDKAVVNLLDNKYWFISFNAESKQDVTYKGKVYSFVPAGPKYGTHQLAEELGRNEEGKLFYPSSVILETADNDSWQYTGFLSAKHLVKILEDYVTVK